MPGVARQAAPGSKSSPRSRAWSAAARRSTDEPVAVAAAAWDGWMAAGCPAVIRAAPGRVARPAVPPDRTAAVPRGMLVVGLRPAAGQAKAWAAAATCLPDWDG